MFSNDPNNINSSSPYNNDPYRARDPYANSGANLNRKDNVLNDPYRHNDPYKHNDPYRHNDPYGFNDPYSNKNPYQQGIGSKIETEKERFSFFWFFLKREIQLLFNAEAGAQDQDLIFPIEEDFMKLRIASKFFIRNIISFFLIVGGFWLTFILIAQIPSKAGELKFVFSLVYFFLILYILFLPTHQVVSSFEYTIYENVKRFYKRIALLFKSYRNSIFAAFIFNIIIGAILIYKPNLLHFFIKNNNISLEFFKKENVKSAFNLLVGITIFSWVLYIIFYNALIKVAEKNRKEHIKARKRKESEFYKHTSKLDDED